MKCSVMGLRKGLRYAFVTPCGAELRGDDTLLIPISKEKATLFSNPMTLEKRDEVEKERLKHTSWEIVRSKAVEQKAEPEPEKIPAKANKSLSGKRKAKNKKA